MKLGGSVRINIAREMVEFYISQKIVPFLWGAPGIGKSSLALQIAENKKFHTDICWNIKDIRMAQFDPVDIRGVPMPDNTTGKSRWYLPDIWPDRAVKSGSKKINGADYKFKAGDCPDGPGILFLDELEKAPQSVKNAALQLILDRQIGDYRLPNDWAVVCAGNRAEDNCGSLPLLRALENRMGHIEVEPNIEDWIDWAANNDISPDILAFLQSNPQRLYAADGDVGPAFPTPRTWHMASKLISSMGDMDDSVMKKRLIASAVGAGTATEFFAWHETYRKIDVKKILEGELPEDFASTPQSFRFAVTCAVSYYVKNNLKDNAKGYEDRIIQFMNIITPEMRALFAKQQSIETLGNIARRPAFKESDMMKEMRSAIA